MTEPPVEWELTLESEGLLNVPLGWMGVWHQIDRRRSDLSRVLAAIEHAAVERDRVTRPALDREALARVLRNLDIGCEDHHDDRDTGDRRQHRVSSHLEDADAILAALDTPAPDAEPVWPHPNLGVSELRKGWDPTPPLPGPPTILPDAPDRTVDVVLADLERMAAPYSVIEIISQQAWPASERWSVGFYTKDGASDIDGCGATLQEAIAAARARMRGS